MKQFKNTLMASLMIASLLLTGCIWSATPQSRQAFVNNNPGLSYQTKQDILKGNVRIGMTMDEVIASWGYPNKSWGKHMSSSGTSEYWEIMPSFGQNVTILFHNGRVSSMSGDLAPLN
jgi:regulatory protein YycH of two-component signal transduction system YycFG